MNKDVVNYWFLVPADVRTDIIFSKYFDKQTSDGSPFCHFNKGYIASKDDDIGSIIGYDDYKDLIFDKYEIRDRFTDIDDFITAFWDGDCEDEDFIPE